MFFGGKGHLSTFLNDLPLWRLQWILKGVKEWHSIYDLSCFVQVSDLYPYSKEKY